MNASLFEILFRKHRPFHLIRYLDGPTGVASLKTTDLKIEDVEGVVVYNLVMMLRIATALNPRPQQIGLALVINISLCQNLR